MKAKNKVFIVTGAGNGIGREVTLELVKKGAFVAALDIDEAGLKTTLKLSNNRTDHLSIHICNITNLIEVEKTISNVKSTYTNIDGIINVAGIVQPFEDVSLIDYTTINRVMNVNFYGTLYLIKSLLPTLLERKEAHIVNVSSMGGFIPVPGQSVYGASKAAVALLSDGLYSELINTPVKVTTIFPGAINTNITSRSGAKLDIDPKTTKHKMMSPLKCAKIIIKGMEQNKYHVYAGNDSKALNILRKFAPRLTARFIAKMLSDVKK